MFYYDHGGVTSHMKKIVYGLLVSFIGISSFTFGFDTVPDPLQKTFLIKDHCRGPRGHKGPRGHTGHRGHEGKQGIPGSGVFSIYDRAYLLAPSTSIQINPDDLPMPVPVNLSDLNKPYFNSGTNSFIVPESGVYRIDYFLNSAFVDAQPSGKSDSGGLVMGIVIDNDTDHPIGIRKLPLTGSLVPGEYVVWGTHQVFVRLTTGQKVQLDILANPNGDSVPVIMEFIQFGDVDDEVAYLSIEKVGS